MAYRTTKNGKKAENLDRHLKLENPLVDDRKPIKVGEDVSGLLLGGKNVYVEGDAEVSGDLKVGQGLTLTEGVTINEGVQTAFTEIKANGTLYLHDHQEDTGGGNTTYFRNDNDNPFWVFTSQGDAITQDWVFLIDGGTEGTIMLFDPDSTLQLDFMTITCAANTVTISNGASGTVAPIVIDSHGGITLDAGDGKFIAKNNGTEFSVANSSYAGMILGYTTVGIDAASDSYAVTNAFVVTDSAHKVTFKAPPSGAVEIEVNFNIITTSQRKLFLGLSDNSTYAAISFPNATDVTNEHIIGDIEIYAFATELSHKWVVTGLTPNDVYTWYLGAKAEQSSRITMHWGGNAGDEFAPFIMKAIALPTAVSDYAVYG